MAFAFCPNCRLPLADRKIPDGLRIKPKEKTLSFDEVKTPEDGGLCPFSLPAGIAVGYLETFKDLIQSFHHRVMDNPLRKRRRAYQAFFRVTDREVLVSPESEAALAERHAQAFQIVLEIRAESGHIGFARFPPDRLEPGLLEILHGTDVVKKPSRPSHLPFLTRPL